jgi:hypothetical protein
MKEWKSIESAPNDGTPILGFWMDGDYVGVGKSYAVTAFRDFEWISLDADDVVFNPPTHWMSLPEPPK